jgi:hypothetical protein
MHAIVEYRIADNLIKQKKVKIKEGKLKIKKKEYSIDRTKEIVLLERGALFKKQYPFYRIKHNMAYPLILVDNPAEPVLKHQNPDTMQKLDEDATMRELLRLQTSDKMNLFLMLMAGAVGAMAGYIIAGL